MEWLGSQSADKPFFGLLTYTLPHAELVQPDDSIVASYRARFAEDSDWPGQEGSRYNATTHTHAQFAAMITRLDTYVGDILRLLREKGLDRNTLVIFTSDNGPHEEGGADPTFFGRDGKLRGLKRQIHEGGIRVPFIAYWPGTIRPGRTSDLQIAFYDIMPTMARLTGVSDFPGRYANPDVADDRFDGISFYPTLMDQPGQAVHPFLYWEFDETDQIGVREGDWKLIVKSGKPHLYNLADDIHEDNDIAAGHPDIVNRLINIIEREHTPNPYFHVTMPKKE